MQPLFFGNNILHLLPYLKCFFRAGCKSLPAVIVRDSLWGLNRCNSGTDGIVRMKEEAGQSCVVTVMIRIYALKSFRAFFIWKQRIGNI